MKATRAGRLFWIGLIFALSACASRPAGTLTAVTSIAGTASITTASVSTVLPASGTRLLPSTVVPATPSPIPSIPGSLGPTELKYRLLAQFPGFFYCDPDQYPVAHANELELARQRFPQLQADKEEFAAILAHSGLADQTSFTDDQKLLIYRQYKQLAAIQLTLVGESYQFQLQVEKANGGGELIAGLIDGQGNVTLQQRTPSIATCPICLAAGTLINTPAGPVPVQDLRLGMPVWTLDKTGLRVARPLVRLGRTIVPANHQVVHLVLDDGRALWVSPGHPTTDGRRVGQLQVGDFLDGGRLLSVDQVPYAGAATYDLLPAGDTGFYWADGILLASTLSHSSGGIHQLP